MKKTCYEIVKAGATYTVLCDGTIILQGFPTPEMASQGVWVEEGSVKGIRFECIDGNVFKTGKEVKEDE